MPRILGMLRRDVTRVRSARVHRLLIAVMPGVLRVMHRIRRGGRDGGRARGNGLRPWCRRKPESPAREPHHNSKQVGQAAHAGSVVQPMATREPGPGFTLADSMPA
ncbi:MAG: hypothetical protein H0T87_07455 [Gammaproteobacteria bacterium]|nr:hypothetical protein [Gammaproteobacteria bacterium]